MNLYFIFQVLLVITYMFMVVLATCVPSMRVPSNATVSNFWIFILTILLLINGIESQNSE